MSKMLSLKIRDDIYSATERIRKKIRMPRNTYINRALEIFNKIQRRKELQVQLVSESKVVSRESLFILHEFEKLENI